MCRGEKHMVFIVCVCACLNAHSDVYFVTRRGDDDDQEKMRTNIDQTNVMLTPSIALLILGRA